MQPKSDDSGKLAMKELRSDVQNCLDSIKSVTLEEVRLAKKYNSAVKTVEMLEKCKREKKHLLDQSNKTREAIEGSIANLKQIQTKDGIEKVRAKQQVNMLSRKIMVQENSSECNLSTIHETDIQIEFKKRLRNSLIKNATGICIDKNSSENDIRGFIADSLNGTVKPFEVEKNKCSETEITEKLQKLFQADSPFKNEWDNIFLYMANC